jgi:hypothetical protein
METIRNEEITFFINDPTGSNPEASKESGSYIFR